MMNRFTKFMTVAAIATLVFTLPVLANPSLPLSATETAVLEQVVDNHAVKTMSDAAFSMATQVDPASAARHIDLVASQVAKLDQEAAKNHLDYLQKRINNAKENVRIKQEIVTNYTNLAKVNPQFEAMIPSAQSDLYNAMVAQAQEEAAFEAAKIELGKYFQ